MAENNPIEIAVKSILKNIGEDANREGLQKTPERVAKAYGFLTQGYQQNAAEVLSQIMDTKHIGVASHLANTIPVEYLPFMAVCQDLGVRNIVVNRMQESKNV